MYALADGTEVTIFNDTCRANRAIISKFPAKEAFYQDLLTTLQTEHSPNDHIVVMGDFNVAPLDKDIGITDDAKQRWLRTGKTSFLPEEREWFQRLTIGV